MFTKDEYYQETFKQLLAKETFSSIEFDRCTFSQCDLSDTVFTHCKFIDCEFIGCNLNSIQFSFSKLTDVNFKDCKLMGVDWTLVAWPNLSISSPVSFDSCLLSHGSFYGLELSELSMQHCKTHEVDFRECNLRQANLNFTDFSYSQFNRTDLTEADLEDAFHYSIDVFNNKIKGAKFSREEALSLLDSLDIELI